MTQQELERALALQTGESLSTIRGRGFSLVEPPRRAPLVVDWDQIDTQRLRVLPNSQRRQLSA